MREILFRGKRADTGEWVEGNLVWIKNLEEQPYQCFIISQLSYLEYGEFDEMYQVFPETVGQFTGLTDKNGKRIFEGDILKVQTRVYIEEDNPVFGKMKAQSEEKRTRYWVVEWVNQTCGGASWYFYGKDRRFNRRASKSTLWNSEAEVVGNIHDNPELREEDA